MRRTEAADAASHNGRSQMQMQVVRGKKIETLYSPDQIAQRNAEMAEQIKASVQVIDDQRAKSYDKVAPEDRYAAMLVAATGDVLLNS